MVVGDPDVFRSTRILNDLAGRIVGILAAYEEEERPGTAR